jgi:hypothetical protein
MPTRIHRLLIPLAALVAILPILVNGPSCGHDFDFHLLSWLEAATQFAHLHYPRWAYTPAYNAGEPRFIFYPPLSWSLGALLGLVLPWKFVPAAFTWIALTLSGFTMHALGRRYAGPHAATLAAILYLANPYMLFTAYERTAYGELLAAAWLPVLFAAALAPRIRIVPLAIPIALLWLSNAPAAVMSCYALAFVAMVRLLLAQTSGAPSQTASSSEVGSHILYLGKRTRLRLALATVSGTLLGLALAAFYLVPAVAERPYIQSDMATIEGMRIADNTLFHHMAPATEDTVAHDLVLYTASTISLTMLAAILLAFVIAERRKPSDGHQLSSSSIPLACLVLLIAFLLTPASLPIWNHTPELRFLQFPWRLTAILGAILGLFAARLFNRLKLNGATTAAANLALAAVLVYPAWQLFHQPCDAEDTVEARVALYHSPRGTEPTDEYTPTAADNDALSKSNPPYWLIPSTGPVDAAAPKGSTPSQAPTNLTLHLATPQMLVLNRRAFFGWVLIVNHREVATQAEARNDGLIEASLPAGTNVVGLTYCPTRDQMLGIIVTVLALVMLLILLILGRLKPNRS